MVSKAQGRAISTASKEADSRIVIDRKLREAGWDIEDKTQVATEETTAKGHADYNKCRLRSRSVPRIFQDRRILQDQFENK